MNLEVEVDTYQYFIIKKLENIIESKRIIYLMENKFLIRMTLSFFLFIPTPILFGIYFILIRYTQNLNEISKNSDLLFVFSLVLPAIALFSLIMRVIIKHNIKSILISSLAIILLFTYLPIYDLFIDGEIVGNEINEDDTFSHIVLLSSLLVTLFVVTFVVVKSKNNFDKILKISFAIALTLVLVNVVEIAYYSNSDKLFTDNSVETFSVNQDNLRDVYFITLDAHASTNALKKYFNYDNSHFEDFLKEKGFFIPKLSFSNYVETKLSMASILNMDYIDLESKSKKEQDLILKQMVIDNAVVKNFKRNGYDIVSFDNEYYLQPSSEPNNVCNAEELRNLKFLTFVVSTTPYAIFKNMFKSMLISILVGTSNDGKDDISFWRIVFPQQKMGNETSNDGSSSTSLQPIIENRKCVFDALPNVQNDFSHPMYVHAHMLVPHGPYFFDSVGNIVNVRISSDEQAPYLAQLQYTNIRIMDSVEQLLENEPKPIIVIQSDHGFRFSVGENDTEIDHGFSNFAAYYFPDEELNENEFAEMTPVNTFRILFNKYFGTNYDILEHKAFHRDNSTFIEVTEQVISNSIFE